MNVIGHEDVGVDRAPLLAGGRPEPVQVDPVVVVVEEDGLPVVAALHHMDRHARQEEAGFARHCEASGVARSSAV
jgi:hypothetical protein